MIRQSAADNAGEVFHIRRHVHREAVLGDASRIHLNTDGGDLRRRLALLRWAENAARGNIGLDEDSGDAVELARHKPKAADRSDDHLLQLSDVAHVIGLRDAAIVAGWR